MYSFYNGYTFPTNVLFKLSLNSQVPEGPLLEIKNLPFGMDHHQLYDLCRPFGILHICNLIKEEGAQKKKAVVQYFTKQDSDTSLQMLVKKTVYICVCLLNLILLRMERRWKHVQCKHVCGL